MARYEDYVKKIEDTEIAAEITEAQEQTQERAKVDVPESVANRFADKTPEEIMLSYANLEKAYSEQGNKLGDMRRSFDDYILQSQSPAPEEPAEEPVTADDLWENPDNAVARVVQKTVGKSLEELEAKIQQNERERALRSFEAKHENARTIAQSPEFLEWVRGSNYRLRLAEKADNFDLEAADELFGLYEDRTAELQTTRRDAALSVAELESSSPDSPTTTGDAVYSRREIINVKQRANLGDYEAKEWLRVNGELVKAAYAEGRIVD